LAFARDVHPTRALGIRKVQSLADLAAVNLDVPTPGFLDAAALLLHRVGGIEPALQMAAAEFPLVVFLVAGSLARLLDLDLVVGKLLNSVRDRGFTSCQGKSSLSRVVTHGQNRTTKYILLEGQ